MFYFEKIVNVTIYSILKRYHKIVNQILVQILMMHLQMNNKHQEIW